MNQNASCKNSADSSKSDKNFAQKKLLIINGSPRPNGTVARILHAIEHEAAALGCETHFVTVFELSFSSCTGCMACQNKGTCVLPDDDAHTVAELIKTCDALAVGTPVYWGNMNGDLKRLFDRLVCTLMDESPLSIPVPCHKGKRAVLVAACTTPFPFNALCGQTTKTFAALREILAASGFKIKGRIALPGTKRADKATPRKLRHAKRCARKLAR